MAEYKTGTYLIPKRTRKINDIRAQVVSATPFRFDPENKPHISVIPHATFSSPDERKRAMDELERSMKNWNRKIKITGLHVWPEWGTTGSGFNGPIVIALDVFTSYSDIQDLREEQKEIIDKHGGELDYQIAEPHLTLAKAGDSDDNVSGLTGFEADRTKEELPEVSGFSLKFEPEVRQI